MKMWLCVSYSFVYDFWIKKYSEKLKEILNTNLIKWLSKKSFLEDKEKNTNMMKMMIKIGCENKGIQDENDK